MINLCISEPVSQMKSYAISSSYVSSYQDDGSGNPKTQVESMLTEEHRDKLNDNPTEIRKYGELFKGEDTPKTPENNKAILTQKASTNVESESKMLGNGEKVSNLNDQQKEVI